MHQWFLSRGPNPSAALVTDSFSNGTNLIDTSHLKLGHDDGTELGALFRYRSLGLEVRHLESGDWSASKGPLTSPGGAVVHYATPLGNTFFPAVVEADYTSAFSTEEYNLHYTPWDRLDLMVGYRTMKLDERLGFSQNIGPDLNLVTYGTRSRNRLHGWQVGVRGLLLGRRDKGFSLDAGIKMGHLHNTIESEAVITQDVGPGFTGQAKEAQGASMREICLGVHYVCSAHVTVSAQYMEFSCSRTALATSQVARLDVVGSGSSVATDHLHYRGLSVGARVTF